MDQGFLHGRIVVEIAHPLTEYAGLILAGLGASVYLVEPPGGAFTRARRPYAETGTESRRSVPFIARNLGKRSLVVDPGSDRDMGTLASLVEAADVLLDAPASPYRAIIANAAGTPRIALTDREGLGISSIVGFAAGGGLSSSGWPHQPPCNAPSWLAQDGASVYAAAMALVAIRERDLGRPAARWDVDYREAAHGASTPWTRPLHSYGMVVAGQGAGSARLGAGPYPILACKDGYIRVLTSTPRQWDAWIALLGNPESLTGPEWKGHQFRAQNFDALVAIASEIVAPRTMADLFSSGQALGLTITPVLDIERYPEDPHIAAREVFHTIEDPDHGAIPVMRPPYRIAGSSPTWALRPAPALDDARTEVESLVVKNTPATPPPPYRPALRLPLEGIRVLSCGVGAVVPEAASMLALLGAEVIKVESRKHVDFLRQVGLAGPGDHNNCPTFNQLNLGALSLAVDMGTPEGRDVVHRLVPLCDIVMENLRGPVMKKWGLDYESVRALRPDIIYLSSQGLGEGPYGGYQTYGPNLQTYSGVTSVWAHPDDPYPVGSTLNHPDHVAGKQALAPLLAALIHRDGTGEGADLDCTQFEVPSAMIADKFLQQHLLPGTVAPLGNASLDFAPHGCYPCSGDDEWCALAVENDAQWEILAGLIGDAWAREPRYATLEARLAGRATLDRKLAEWTSAYPAVELETVLRRAGIPASRVVCGDDLVNDIAAHESGLFACVPHPTAGNRWHMGLPVCHSDDGSRFPVKRSPLLGEHDAYVLFDLLNMQPHEVDALAQSNAIGY